MGHIWVWRGFFLCICCIDFVYVSLCNLL